MPRKPPLSAKPLDARDLHIVDALQRDAWLSYADLAKRVHLSASAVQRRVERLIADGVILGAGARVAHDKLGRGMRIFVLVELRDESTATLSAFARKLKAAGDVVDAHYLAGAYDVMVTLRAASMADYAAFAAAALNDNPHVRRYKTLTELKALV